MTATAGKAFSQEKIPEEKNSKFHTDFGADFVSSYIWRGLQVDPTPNIQAWGEFGISVNFECIHFDSRS